MLTKPEMCFSSKVIVNNVAESTVQLMTSLKSEPLLHNSEGTCTPLLINLGTLHLNIIRCLCELKSELLEMDCFNILSISTGWGLTKETPKSTAGGRMLKFNKNCLCKEKKTNISQSQQLGLPVSVYVRPCFPLSLRSLHILISMFPACIDQVLITNSPIWCRLSRCKRKIEGRKKETKWESARQQWMKEYVQLWFFSLYIYISKCGGDRSIIYKVRQISAALLNITPEHIIRVQGTWWLKPHRKKRL